MLPESEHSKLDENSKQPHHQDSKVNAILNFFQDPETGATPYLWVPGDSPYSKNFGDAQIEVAISDVRGRESAFDIDHDGLELVSNVPSTVDDFSNESSIKSVYLPEIELLLLNHIAGAQKVTVFDYTIRRSHEDSISRPALRVHCDQTPRSAEWRVQLHDAECANELLRRRYRIINVWRPINGKVESYPLAFASAQTVREEDLVTVEHRSPKRTGETAGVRYHDDQKWYYWSGMGSDEVVLLKCFDSSCKPGVAKRTPHSAFEYLDQRAKVKERESIEVRALVYS